jgi:hypothetical protein
VLSAFVSPKKELDARIKHANTLLAANFTLIFFPNENKFSKYY